MTPREVTVVIPAYNEEETIRQVVEEAQRYGDEVLVVDDGSTDHTPEKAEEAGARVICHGGNRGYLQALRTGFQEASGQVVVTMDADGQLTPGDIPRLVKPIREGRLDLVVGARKKLSSFSEWIITQLTRFRVPVTDASSGFKALKREIARKMRLEGRCICGTFVLEAARLGARVGEVKVEAKERQKGESKMRKKHLIQTLLVAGEVLRPRVLNTEFSRV